MATVTQTVVVQCANTSERVAFVAQITAWGAANPGQVVSIATSQNKITVTMLTYTASPS